MPTLKVAFNATTKVVRVVDAATATPGGFVSMGTFVHPDETYPDSVVVYHGVRDLLYKRSAANPANPAMFPDNITNLHDISIEFLGTPRLVIQRNLPATLVIPENTDATLEVVAVGGKTPLHYAWYKDEEVLVGETSSILNFDAAFAADNGMYQVKVTDNVGTFLMSKVTEVVVTSQVALEDLLATPDTLSLSVATDLVAGKDSVISPVPSTAFMGTLSIEFPPNPAIATATLEGNVLNVKPVAAGSASIVVTNGLYSIEVIADVTA